MNEDRAAIRRLIDELMRRHGVRPNYRPHVASVLFHCHGDEAGMEQAINELYANCRSWFF